MAKLSAHGAIIGEVVFTTSVKRYMEDGVVLKNSGFGWKLRSRLKPGIAPIDAFNCQLENQRKVLSEKPATVAYREALHGLCGLSKRWKLHAAVSLMPDDCDGVWSEACDGYGDNVSADIDDISALCKLYLAMIAENMQRQESITTNTSE